MPRITEKLLRKRAEHNECMLSTLEEISLHQEELERIECIGTICRKLKILLLQNNIINKMENLHHLKQLEYLNLALNNIGKVEGLESCEFLNKLDLTVNFIDVDVLEESIDNLKHLQHLREMYWMGNPAQIDWPGFNRYVIASLPRLEFLDGKEISRTERILASQEYNVLQAELRALAKAKKAEKDAEAAEKKAEADAIAEEQRRSGVIVEDVGSEEEEEDETTPYTPETRNEMYLEIAEQKEEKELREKERMPKERDAEKEHKEALEATRKREEEGNVRQVNEGKLDFRFDETEKPGFIILYVGVPKFLDTSLIDVDVHPSFVSVVLKNKTLRLVWPEEVVPDNGSCQRSKLTGELVLTLPCMDKKKTLTSIREKERLEKDKKQKAEEEKENQRKNRKLTQQEEVMEASKAVNITGIVKNNPNSTPLMKEVTTTKKQPSQQDKAAAVPPMKAKAAAVPAPLDDDGCPPLF
jgi:protein TilB